MRSFLIIIITLLICSCEEVITLDISKSQPRIVIEGVLSNKKDIHIVKISQTVGFYDNTANPPVSGAEVSITGSFKFNEHLTEISPGVYATGLCRGLPGNTYTLTVKIDGVSYESRSFMPHPISTVNTYYKEESFELWTYKKDGYRLYCDFLDPEYTDNMIMLRTKINGQYSSDISLYNDEYSDGGVITYKIPDIGLEKGDKAQISLCSIDEKTYNYFKGVKKVSNNSSDRNISGPFTGMPANPVGNFTNNALGYFVALSIKESNIVKIK